MTKKKSVTNKEINNLRCGPATVKPSRKKYIAAPEWTLKPSSDFQPYSEMMERLVEHEKNQETPEINNKYHAMAHKVASIVTEKQIAYGDSFGRAGAVLRELYPNGIRPDQYDDMLTIVRVIDKLFRVANKKDAFGESPWGDINGYSLLELAKEKK